MSNTKTEVASVEHISIFDMSLNCPHCEVSQDGWLSDPRGRNHECDECGLTYHVPQDVQIRF